MRLAFALPLVLLAALCGCGRRSGVYADRSVPLAESSAAPQATPRFVGRWAASADGCDHPWVFEARNLSSADAQCEFDKVEPSPAGYGIIGVCRSPSGPKPVRIIVTTPNKPQVALLSVSGGPFANPTALQRCGAP
jgi:hypothetical protein